MQTRTRSIAPCAIDRIPAGNDPVSSVRTPGDGITIHEEFVVVGLLLEGRSRLQHDTILNTQIAERLGRAILQPHLHLDVILCRPGGRSEFDAVRKSPPHLINSVAPMLPFQFFQVRPIGVPDCLHVGVCQIRESKVGTDCFRYIHDNVTVIVPWTERAEFRFSLRFDGTVQESNPRMPTARIRQQ